MITNGMSLSSASSNNEGLDNYGNLVDWMAEDGATQPFYAVATPYNAIYDATQRQTWVSYNTYSRGFLTTKIRVFDHVSKEWSNDYVVRIIVKTDDDHTVPSIVMDNDGYVHCFCGAHNTTMKYTRTKNSRDPSTWLNCADISGEYTYSHPVNVNGTIVLFLRKNYTALTKMTGVLFQSTSVVSGVITWGSEVTYGDFGTDSRYYLGHMLVKNGKVHMVSTRANYYDTYRRNVYYLIYDPSTGSVSNIDGSHSVASASLPISLADHISYFLVYAHGASPDNGNVPPMAFDSSGVPHVLINKGNTEGDGTSSGGFGDTSILHTKYSGGAWTTPELVASCSQRYESCGIISLGNNKMQIAYSSDSQTDNNHRGGDIYTRDLNADGSWNSPVKVLTQSYLHAFENCAPVVGGEPELRWIFAEESTSYNVDNVQMNYDVKAGYQRIYAYGQYGFVKSVCTKDIKLDKVGVFSDATSGSKVAQIVSTHARDSIVSKISVDGKFSFTDDNVFLNGAVSEGERHDIVLLSNFRGTKRLKRIGINIISSTTKIPSVAGSPTAWFDTSISESILFDSNGVSQLSDLSGNGNHLTQTTDSIRPILGKTNAHLIGNNSSIVFESGDSLNFPSSLYTIPSSAHTIIAVFARQNEWQEMRVIFGADAGSNRWGFQSRYSANKVKFTSGYSASGPDATYVGQTDVAPHIYMGRRNGTTVGIRLDGGTETTNTSGANVTLTQMWIGTPSGTYYSGRFGAMAIYNSALTDAQMNAIGLYLARKYDVKTYTTF